MPTAEERLAILEEVLTEAAGKGLLQLEPDDGVLDGRTISFDGREVVSFGSCSYLGLELDDRLKQATIDAVLRYGTQFSSSRGYLSSPQYIELEALLGEMFGGHVLVDADDVARASVGRCRCSSSPATPSCSTTRSTPRCRWRPTSCA